MSERIWTFKTDRFTIALDAEQEFDLDLSWDESGEIAEGIESGEFDVFCAAVRVLFDGQEIAADYLGQCIYRAGEFETSHRDSNPMSRNCSIMRAANGGNMTIGHYFPDMVRTAIGEAREHIRTMQPVYIRATA